MPLFRQDSGDAVLRLEGFDAADIGAEPAGAEQRAKNYADTLLRNFSADSLAVVLNDQKGQPDGLASLDGASKVPVEQIPISSIFENLDIDLAEIAKLNTQPFGRFLLTIADPPAGRATLGLGTIATQPSADFLKKSDNLSGLTSPGTARTNLGLGTMATASTTSYLPLTGGVIGGRLQCNEFLQFNTVGQGLYSPHNNTYFVPNDGVYGSWKIQGSRNNWAGIEFVRPGSNMTLMMGADSLSHGSQYYGFYANVGVWLCYGVHQTWYCGSLVQYSDLNLKENINLLNSTLDKLNSIFPCTFDWKESKDRTHYGLIAQQVQEIFPDLVVETNGKLHIAYTEFIPIIIKAIQELQCYQYSFPMRRYLIYNFLLLGVALLSFVIMEIFSKSLL